MDKNILPLHKLPVGSVGRVVTITVNGPMRRRMSDLGIIGDTAIEVLQKSPAGNPIAYSVRGAVIAFRNEDAKNIWVIEKK